MSPFATRTRIGADSGLARQSASWYCFSASTPQKCFSRYASENFGNCNTRAACPVSNMFTTYTLEVALQPLDVVIGAVHDLGHARVLERRAEFGAELRAHGGNQNIDHVVALACADLH